MEIGILGPLEVRADGRTSRSEVRGCEPCSYVSRWTPAAP